MLWRPRRPPPATPPANRGKPPPPPPPATDQFDAVVLADASAVAGRGAANSITLGGDVAAAPVVATLRTSARAALFTAAAALPGASHPLPFDAALVLNSPDVAAIVVDSAKPARPADQAGATVVVVVSTRAAGARLAAAMPPPAAPPPEALAEVGAHLWRAAAAVVLSLPPPSAPPLARRWGAGLETTRVPSTHAIDGRLAACGDLFCGPVYRSGIDAALASGLAAGEAVAEACGL